MDAADRVAARMRPLFLLQAAGFFAWQVSDGVASSQSASPDTIGIASLVAIGGCGVWLVSFLIFALLAWRAKKDGIYDLMQDEWSQHVRKRAAEVGFWVLLVCTVVGMTATKFGVEASILLQTNVGIGVAGYILASLWLDSRDEGDA